MVVMIPSCFGAGTIGRPAYLKSQRLVAKDGQGFARSWPASNSAKFNRFPVFFLLFSLREFNTRNYETIAQTSRRPRRRLLSRMRRSQESSLLRTIELPEERRKDFDGSLG